MAVLGLRFCARAFSSCGERGPLFIAVRGPLTIAASLVAEHKLQTRRLSSCGSRAQLLRGMWDLPRPGLEPMSPALAGRFSTTVPPGKPCLSPLSLSPAARPVSILPTVSAEPWSGPLSLSCSKIITRAAIFMSLFCVGRAVQCFVCIALFNLRNITKQLFLFPFCS